MAVDLVVKEGLVWMEKVGLVRDRGRKRGDHGNRQGIGIAEREERD